MYVGFLSVCRNELTTLLVIVLGTLELATAILVDDFICQNVLDSHDQSVTCCSVVLIPRSSCPPCFQIQDCESVAAIMYLSLLCWMLDVFIA